MYYEVYLDVLFVINILMDYFLLRLVNRFVNGSAKWWKSLLGAAIGAAGICLLSLVSWGKRTGMIMVHVIINTMMVKIGCNPKTVSQLLKSLGFLYGTSFFMGGMLQVLFYFTGSSGVKSFVCTAAGSYAVLSIGIRFYFRMVKEEKKKYTVYLSVNDKTIVCSALLDTGNSLLDPVTGKPVNVGAWSILGQLFPENMEKKLKDFMEGRECDMDFGKLNPRFLPFTGMGCSTGLALAVTLDYLKLEGQKVHMVIKRPVVAFSKENSSFGGKFQVILHPDLINSQEEFI